MDEIWSKNLVAYPMNRSLRIEVTKIRKIRSHWKEYLYGDKFASDVTFFDEHDQILGMMNSHH